MLFRNDEKKSFMASKTCWGFFTFILFRTSPNFLKKPTFNIIRKYSKCYCRERKGKQGPVWEPGPSKRWLKQEVGDKLLEVNSC